MKLYVGNLNYTTSEDQLRQAFGAFGEVSAVSIVADRETGRSRGFAFVEFSNDEEGKAAIAGMNGKDFDGRLLKVNQARPPRNDSGFGRGGGGGRGEGGGGRGGRSRSGW